MIEWIEKSVLMGWCIYHETMEKDWMSLYMVEITLYSIHSCTLSQCRDLRIWSRQQNLGAAATVRARAFWGAEGALTAI